MWWIFSQFPKYKGIPFEQIIKNYEAFNSNSILHCVPGPFSLFS